MVFLCFSAPAECDHDWEGFDRTELISMCRDYHADVVTQVGLVSSLKLHLALRASEAKSAVAEAGSLREELCEVRAENVRLRSELQAVKSELLEVNKVDIPWFNAERSRMNTLLARSGRVREHLSEELKELKERFRDLSVKYTSLGEVAKSQSIDNVRKFLELSRD
jgi:uncharacterized coiled-coil DUF342 family protein